MGESETQSIVGSKHISANVIAVLNNCSVICTNKRTVSLLFIIMTALHILDVIP